MNILIVDDEKEVCETIKDNLTEKCAFKLNITCSVSFSEALEIVQGTKRKIDVILMDIDLKTENGIDLAFIIQQKFGGIRIIFITGYDDYFESIFLKVKPYAFVKKPINYTLLLKHLNEIQENIEPVTAAFFDINNRKESIPLNFNDIIYFESKLRTITVHTYSEDFKLYGKLSDIESVAPGSFVRCHQSFLVNSNYIKRVSSAGSAFVLVNNKVLPISRAKSESAVERFYKFKGGLV